MGLEPERLAALAESLGPGHVWAECDVTDQGALDRAVAEAVRALGDEVGVPRGLGALGVRAEDIPRLSELTLSDACLTTNPRHTAVEDVAAMFRAAL